MISCIAGTHHFEEQLEHLFESLKAPLFFFVLLLLQVQHSLEPFQGSSGVLLLQTLGAVVLVLYLYLLIVATVLAFVCVVLYSKKIARDLDIYCGVPCCHEDECKVKHSCLPNQSLPLPRTCRRHPCQTYCQKTR